MPNPALLMGPVVLRGNDVLDLLANLIDKSLVVREHREDRGGRGRYRLLEVIRQFATDRLLESGVEGAIRRRHLTYFLGLAEEAASELRGPHQVEWLNRLERDYDNLRAAGNGPRPSRDTRKRACGLWQP